ncbi:response regulator [Candidatus Neptunochlamydia vexilliferae]|uniref:Response regulatory domain-containing protein n=1 Tax=Candidatus Neptunichlamydia vexilliferae TaxID=1651774 RepID=A0ABS0B2J7_9BACT|nr:response regulator [Candidatus Neptunochlamydia vexilliferae]MBF5060097.1 hypothetical protein [Candidatus Neptunochlamydia vexilliferae]
MNIKLKKLPTLLLVSDNPLTVGFFEGVVDKLEEYALITSSSERDALESLEKVFVSFIVIDDKIVDTIALCSKIRALKEHEHTPILVITGQLKKSFIRNVMKAGATDFLAEPLEEDEFLMRMEVAQKATQTQAKMVSLSSRVPKQEEDASLGKRTVKKNPPKKESSS